MGGLGKTEMARNLALSFKNKCHVFWVDCRTKTAMETSFHAIGSELNSSVDNLDVALNRGFLLNYREDWLLIIDNVDDEEALTYVQNNILSSAVHGRILVTGKLTTLSRIKTPLEMPLMKVEEAKSLLRKLVPSDLYTDTEAQLLAETLELLPLAVEQAGLYIHSTGKSISTYLQLYSETEMKPVLLAYKPASIYTKPALFTFDISLQKAPKDAQQLLNIFALIGPTGVSDDFLSRAAEHHPQGNWPLTDCLTDFGRGIPLPEDYSSVLRSLARREVAVDSLVEVALLKRLGTRLMIHSVRTLIFPIRFLTR